MRLFVTLLALAGVMGLGSCKAAKDFAAKRRAEREAAGSQAGPGGGSATTAAESEPEASKPPPPPPRPVGPGLAPGRYRVVEVDVEVEARNGRKSWDRSFGSNPAPDLIVKVRADSQVIATCNAGDDTTRGRCRLDAAFELDERTRIELEVVDDDGDGDFDAIGGAAMTDPSWWGLGYELPLLPSGKVRAASLVLRAAPSWWALYGARVIAFGLGVAAALGVAGLFRRSLLVADPAAPPKPRCTHCGALIRRNRSRCANCGAVQ